MVYTPCCTHTKIAYVSSLSLGNVLLYSHTGQYSDVKYYIFLLNKLDSSCIHDLRGQEVARRRDLEPIDMGYEYRSGIWCNEWEIILNHGRQ